MTEEERDRIMEKFEKEVNKRIKYSGDRLSKIEKIEEENLTIHGMYDKGYFEGYSAGVDSFFMKFYEFLKNIEVQ